MSITYRGCEFCRREADGRCECGRAACDAHLERGRCVDCAADHDDLEARADLVGDYRRADAAVL